MYTPIPTTRQEYPITSLNLTNDKGGNNSPDKHLGVHDEYSMIIPFVLTS